MLVARLVVFTATAFALALTGPGTFSLDAALGIDSLWSAQTAWLAIAVAVAGAVANLAARRLPDDAQPTAAQVSTT